jgi:hypothetical protein
MWAIDNYTPYKVLKTWGRDQDGVHEWIVCVKAIFEIKPDSQVALADEQREPLRLAEYHGEPGQSSVRYDAELVGVKPTTDIVVNGTAYAPGGRPSTQFPIGLRVGSIEKVLIVKGNRMWERGIVGMAPSAVQPVTRVPILYERAYGGYDHAAPDPQEHRLEPRNPVGCGLAPKGGKRAGDALPNFEYPNGNLERDGPAGFGAIDSHWSPRRELAGTYDRGWEQHRRPLLPTDWDRRSLLCSPTDQRPAEFLRGGEVVELTNLTPEGRLRFELPRVYLTFSTEIDQSFEEHRGHLTTVIIEPDDSRLIMVWSTSIKCGNNGDYLEETVVREKPFIR